MRRLFQPWGSPVALLLILVILARRSESSVLCNETYNPCEELLWKGSECRQGVCSNPFEKGCLVGMASTLQDEEKKEMLYSFLNKYNPSQIRVCSSDDPPTASAQGLCVNHSTSSTDRRQQDELYADYKEVRILSQNWESAYFSAWIMQIILSELLHVPTTIESLTRNHSLHNNFYDPLSRLEYGDTDIWSALKRANQLEASDCTLVQQRDDDDEEYQSCGNVVMESWYGVTEETQRHLEQGTIENLVPLGAIGQQALFVTKFTAEADPTILNLHGIQGDANRHKLAATFKRPTTWRDYCELVSPSNCTDPDDTVAQRPPLDEFEYDRMHVPDMYTGHFRDTDDNNCTLHPDTCTGHIADFPCGWTSYVIPQMYHNKIALRSEGKEQSKGYTYQQLSDMWAAANATNSNLVGIWWTPEAIHSTYLGSRAEMQRISLTWPTQQCQEKRIANEDRCNYETIEQQVGVPEGSCDEAPQMLYKNIVKNMHTATYHPSIPEAKRSPAYDTIKLFSISELQQSDILQAWINRNIDKWGFDLRMATCEYVVDNLDHIESLIPRTYPRVVREGSVYEDPLMMSALAWATLATVLTIASTIITYVRRECYAIRYAQLDFLLLLLLGLFLICLGAVVTVMDPNDFACSLSLWLVVLGYTIQLIPAIVKASAIHKLMKAAQRLQRLDLPKTQLFGTVLGVTTGVIIYLAVWTAMDPRQRKNEFFIHEEEVTEHGQTIVTMEPYCSSSGAFWNFVALAWYCFMMLMATVLAFKSRHIREEFNESKTLFLMVYAHFLFLVLLVASLLFDGALPEAYLVAIRSFIYSTDSIVTLLIYFLPKFTAHNEPRHMMHRQTSAVFPGNHNQIGGSSSIMNRFSPDHRNGSGQPGSSSFFNGHNSAPQDTSSIFNANRHQQERSPSTEESEEKPANDEDQ
ncbi:expressed unknown protein [Seminavis robusta]|uniref:G-protein coupled receptors family 3 profile domain-containing protein n=1 Tax=Seminavis robusta TaxID=568900 RepID=A0A9N8H4B5_9STRA|nr:expressed unknown protein [Seminavis robusta]|eukprot:Sro58_g033710.1 n/a (920) ;mRNA; r:56413-59293